MKPIYYNETPTAKIVVYNNGKVFIKRYVEKFKLDSGETFRTFKEWGEWEELEDLPQVENININQ